MRCLDLFHLKRFVAIFYYFSNLKKNNCHSLYGSFDEGGIYASWVGTLALEYFEFGKFDA